LAAPMRLPPLRAAMSCCGPTPYLHSPGEWVSRHSSNDPPRYRGKSHCPWNPESSCVLQCPESDFSRALANVRSRRSDLLNQSRQFQNPVQIFQQRVPQVCLTRTVYFENSVGNSQTRHGKLPDTFPSEWPSTLSAHFLHTRRGTTSANSQSDG